MRKKLALLVVAAALAAGSALVEPAAALTCPAGSHLVTCPTRTFCCPDFARCVCLPIT
ncbi:MAG TPA: hypothetical protein VGH73_08545 [Thermoanaerobaculia bacterium]|jgi:hypothetical protein